MFECEYSEVEVGDQTYILTFADVTGKQKNVVAVTDVENDMHYMSEEVEAAFGDIMPTATVPDCHGVPENFETVSVYDMSQISKHALKEDSEALERSLAELELQYLETQPREKNDEDALQRAELQNSQGVNPEKLDSEDYPIT